MRRSATGLLVLTLLWVTVAACRSEATEPFRSGPDATAPGLQSPSAAAAPSPDPALDDLANFLAGLPCQRPALKTLQEMAEYKDYAAALEKSWTDVEAKRLLPMRGWAEAELGEAAAATQTLFYPFGGPDFLTALVIFPDVTTYVIQGLEFVGKLPSFEGAPADRVKTYTQSLLDSLSDFFNKSYFITKNMNAALTGDKVDGVLPVLVFFLKRTNHAIVSVRRSNLGEKGEVVESAYPGERKRFRRPYGIKIEFFAGGSTRLRTLFYFSADFVDSVFRPETAFHQYLEALPFETVFLKSASYLMHYREFSNIRNVLLSRGRFILQDDTGIPYRFFPERDWDVQLYGEYLIPVKDFSGVEQPDLKAAYADPAKVRKLPFHLGYHWGTSKDAILFIRRKTRERP
jgi:hypothetical protein